MTNSIMNPLELAQEAYDKDFRWWFLALLVCVFVAGVWVFKYLISRMDRMEQAHSALVSSLVAELASSRQHHHDRWEAITAQYFKQTSELAAIIAANTAESKELRHMLSSHVKTI